MYPYEARIVTFNLNLFLVLEYRRCCYQHIHKVIYEMSLPKIKEEKIANIYAKHLRKASLDRELSAKTQRKVSAYAHSMKTGCFLLMGEKLWFK